MMRHVYLGKEAGEAIWGMKYIHDEFEYQMAIKHACMFTIKEDFEPIPEIPRGILAKGDHP